MKKNFEILATIKKSYGGGATGMKLFCTRIEAVAELNRVLRSCPDVSSASLVEA